MRQHRKHPTEALPSCLLSPGTHRSTRSQFSSERGGRTSGGHGDRTYRIESNRGEVIAYLGHSCSWAPGSRTVLTLAYVHAGKTSPAPICDVHTPAASVLRVYAPCRSSREKLVHCQADSIGSNASPYSCAARDRVPGRSTLRHAVWERSPILAPASAFPKGYDLNRSKDDEQGQFNSTPSSFIRSFFDPSRASWRPPAVAGFRCLCAYLCHLRHRNETL